MLSYDEIISKLQDEKIESYSVDPEQSGIIPPNVMMIFTDKEQKQHRAVVYYDAQTKKLQAPVAFKITSLVNWSETNRIFGQFHSIFPKMTRLTERFQLIISILSFNVSIASNQLNITGTFLKLWLRTINKMVLLDGVPMEEKP